MSKRFLLNKERRNFYAVYTLVFAILALILYLHFYLNGKSLIWSHDGVPQHLNALAYYGGYLRDILKSIFIDHDPAIPMWDMNIGYGSDILTDAALLCDRRSPDSAFRICAGGTYGDSL